jgi:arylsulfatase A-like enzyme
MKQLYFLAILLGTLFSHNSCQHSAIKPANILWIYVEDISPNLGCYGDELVLTPHIDSLAMNGVRFTNMYMPAPVCSPCRSALITGCMPTTLGLHNHHSSRDEASAIYLPDSVKTIPELFKEAGYFTFNKGKDDYNFMYDRTSLYSDDVYDNGMYGLIGKNVDWRNRAEGQPFFGQIQLYGNKYIYNRQFKDKIIRKIDPDSVQLPPYYPDSTFMRQEWADYLACIELTDKDVGQIIHQLREDKLLTNTYVFFFSDHGMRLWRHKQFLYDSGIQVPFIMAYFGEDGKIGKGTINTDLLSGIDIGITSLGLAGIKAPSYVEGIDFLARNYHPRDFVVAVRDRCDFTIDRIRAIRTREFKYIRNYFTNRPYMQPNYRDEWEISKKMRSLVKDKKLNPIQNQFWDSHRPAEELYDLRNDPFEIHNLAENKNYANKLSEMKKILDSWIRQTDDKGQYPESDEGLRFMYEKWGDKCINPEYEKFKTN